MREILAIPPGVPGRIWPCRNPAVMAASHHHAELEINLVVSGRAGYICQRQRYEIGPRSLLFLFPAHEHHLVRSSRNFQMWIAVFRRDFLRRCLPSSSLLLRRNPQGSFCRVASEDDARFLEELARRVARAADADALRGGLACFLHEARGAYERTAADVDFADLHPAVENAIRLLRQGGGEEGLEELGRQAGLSRSHLSRLFHKQVGMTTVRYRNQLRLEAFWRIYGNGERINLLDAALAAGFGSYGQFYRVFREHIGQSPQEVCRAGG